MKAYKGFNRDMTCRGFQYEEGQTYETDEAKLCESGFHACEDPLDCFGYYKPAESVYHEVELDAEDEMHSDDSKRVGKRIRIGAALDVAGICKAHFEYVKEHCTNEYNAEPGKPATAGNGGAATAGNGGAATAGEYGAATAGNHGAATAGNGGAATAGNGGAATAGNGGAATAGEYGAATSRGNATVGVNGIACVRGNGCKVRGGMGAVLVAGEEKQDSYDLVAWKAAVVDGVNLKPDTWYMLKDGEFVEVEE